MISAYSSAQLAYSAHSARVAQPALAADTSVANGAVGLYARQNLPAAAARTAASLAAGEGGSGADSGSGADKVSISPEALALQRAERDGAAATLPSAPSRFAANGVPVDFAPWQAAVRETEQRIEERVALYKKGKETDAADAMDDAILRRIAAYDEMLAGSYLPAPEAPPVAGAPERAGGGLAPRDAPRHSAGAALN